jgi:hypothetical protein
MDEASDRRERSEAALCPRRARRRLELRGDGVHRSDEKKGRIA